MHLESRGTVLMLRMTHRKWKEMKQTSKPVAWPSLAWLLLSFFPFPVGHPEHEHCTLTDYAIETRSNLMQQHSFSSDPAREHRCSGIHDPKRKRRPAARPIE